MEENKLDFKAQSNYIVVTEKDNPKNVAQIEYNRTVSILSGSTFTPENLQKIYHMAEHGNMICPGFESFFPHGHLVLTPINRLSKEYLNPETDIVEQFCIETIDGKEYVCTGKGVIVPKLPEDFNDIPHISNPEDKKYMLTNYTKEYDGQTLYRIRALKDFGNVKAGELGGFVSGEHNLSQEGDCWVDYFATVTHNARITDNAIVSGKAVVTDNARITENIIINDNVKIGGDVKLSEYAQIKGFACTDKQEQADGICSQGKTSQSKRLFLNASMVKYTFMKKEIKLIQP